ncbi:hypothetical protein [Desulfovulcanus sp.]
MKKIWFLFIWMICLFFILSSAWAQNQEEVVVEAEGSYLMGDRDSKQTARELALYEAKRMALEKAGTVLASSTRVENYEVVKDEILSRAAGRLKVEVLEEKWEHCDSTMRVRVRIRARIKPEYLEADLDEQQSPVISSTNKLSGSSPQNTQARTSFNKQVQIKQADFGQIFANIYQLIRQHKYRLALQKVKGLEARLPNLPRVHILKAQIYHVLHKERLALASLKRACSLGSDKACKQLSNLHKAKTSVLTPRPGPRPGHFHLPPKGFR